MLRCASEAFPSYVAEVVAPSPQNESASMRVRFRPRTPVPNECTGVSDVHK
jgi:hypothetical protein